MKANVQRPAAALAIAATLWVASSVATPAQTAAADPARIAAARELIAATDGAKVFDTMIGLIMQKMSAAMTHRNPAEAEQIKQIFASLTEKAIKRKSEAIEQVAGVYAKRFSADELKAITAFYKSGVGAKFVSQQHDIIRESIKIGQKWGAKLGREIQKEAQQELDRKHGKQ